MISMSMVVTLCVVDAVDAPYVDDGYVPTGLGIARPEVVFDHQRLIRAHENRVQLADKTQVSHRLSLLAEHFYKVIQLATGYYLIG